MNFFGLKSIDPKLLKDCILPENIKKTFKDFLEKGEVPNLLLAGPAGCGKTTVAKALCHELGVDYYVINGSDEGRFLDTVRNNAKNFASTVSITSDAKHKVIIIDEADNTTNDVQLLLRKRFTEEFSGNCRFVFTCNYKNKIIEPLHSRCSLVEFGIGGNQNQLQALFFQRIRTILETERVEYDPKVIVELVNNTSQIGDVFLTNVRDILPVVKLILVFLLPLVM